MEANKEDKNSGLFEDFGKKMDRFMVELKEAGKRMDTDMQKKYDELKVSAERLKKEAQNKERWKEVESGLKKAGEELEKTVKAAFKKREP
jgi:hypothetical protein